MPLLNHLAPQALLGTERKPPQLPHCDGQLGLLLNDLQSQPAEPQLLRAAGAIALAQRVVFAPTASNLPLLATSPAETRPVAEAPALLSCLRMIFEQKQPLLIQEALLLLKQAQQLLPPQLLPLVLNQAKDYAELLVEVVGERGFWLAKLNPEWSYLAGRQLDFNIWEHGTFNERLGFIQQLRQQQPEQARDLIMAALAELDARDRVKLLDTLQTQLSDADIPALEPLLRDRSKEVRMLAVKLLLQLPNSTLVQRLQQHVQQLGASLEPPEQFVEAWKTEQIEAKRPQYESLGERAWWLYQLARGVPLNWWLQQRSAADWLAWVKNSDWSAALLRAWYEATLREGHPAWAQAFLDAGRLKGIDIDALALINTTPNREQHWLGLLRQASMRRGYLLNHIVRQKTPVSAEFAEQTFSLLQQVFSEKQLSHDYELRSALPDFACLVPLRSLQQANRLWSPSAEYADYVVDTLTQLHTIQQHRSTLHQYLSPTN